MARRSRGPRAVDLTVVGDAFLRLAGAIVLDTLAFVVWNVGTRAPLRVLADIGRGLRRPRTALAGTAAAFVGAIFVLAAGVLLVPALAVPALDFAPAELFTLLVALALEHTIGPDLRRLAAPAGAEHERRD